MHVCETESVIPTTTGTSPQQSRLAVFHLVFNSGGTVLLGQTNEVVEAVS